MQTQIEITPNGIEITGPYSTSNNGEWRILGGKFINGRWLIPDTEPARLKVAELFGERSEDVTVAITADNLNSKYENPVQVGGYVRDYAAQMAPGVVVAKGSLPHRGGSHKSPSVNVTSDVVSMCKCDVNLPNQGDCQSSEHQSQKPKNSPYEN